MVEMPDNNVEEFRPQEGDLIYLPLANSLFEIKFVEHEQPFYQLRNLPTYQLQCELFEYSHESIDTGINSVDDFETTQADSITLAIAGGTDGFTPREEISQRVQTFKASNAALTAVIDTNSGEIASVTIDESGFGYETPPDIVVPKPLVGTRGEVTATIDSAGQVDSVTITNSGSGYTATTVDIFDITESPVEDRPEVLVTGEVADLIPTQDADPNTGAEREADLRVTGISASDGSLSGFEVAGENIVRVEDSVDSGWLIEKIYDIRDRDQYFEPTDEFADNSSFEIESDQILDFSESNPFGDPQEQV